MVAAAIAFAGYLAPLRAGARMNPLEVADRRSRAAFVFVYLLWALLRPEDF